MIGDAPWRKTIRDWRGVDDDLCGGWAGADGGAEGGWGNDVSLTTSLTYVLEGAFGIA